MKLFILEANSSKEMEDLAVELSESKFVMVEQDKQFILMKKRRYGNLLIHVISLIIALQFTAWFILLNLVYFIYSYLWASPHVLITTEKKTDDGEDLQFNTMDEILKKANAIL